MWRKSERGTSLGSNEVQRLRAPRKVQPARLDPTTGKSPLHILQGKVEIYLLYKLTPAGRKQLVEETSNWQRLSTAINLILKTT